jgi:lipopolysaccharide transport system ATP-binding protein
MSIHVVDREGRSIAHLYSYSSERQFATFSGRTMAICNIPNPLLNVGSYSLTVHLAEPPGGEHYDTIENVCWFDVVRQDYSPYWGWREIACTYFESFDWRFERRLEVPKIDLGKDSEALSA